MIQEFVKLIPPSLMKYSGAVFNSGRTAFSNPCELYLLGLNPGGAPERHVTQTVEFHTDAVLAKPDKWAEYRDEEWDGRKAGTSGLQPRVLHVLREVGLEAHDVPSSNVVFKRTSNQEALEGDFNQLADLCWPFHEAVIEKLQVSTILCFGKRAGNWVRKKAGAHEYLGRFEETNLRKWKTEAFSSKKGIVVISATHPSRVDWTKKATNPALFIKRMIDREFA